jgi:site-specific DNA-methyltransferase (adenine-specific)
LKTVLQGDNLDIMRSIESNTIDLIYNDILYNTGKTFEDYNDNLGLPGEAIEWYRPRFIEMKRLLKDTGIIYIQCDYNLSHYIKILLDEIFGVNQFRNEIIWWYNSAPRKAKDFGCRHDTIFRYSKTENYYFNDNSNRIRQKYSSKTVISKSKKHYYNEKGKVIDDVWKIPMLSQKDRNERVGYSTQKPKHLLELIIDSSCPQDGIVGDFFCGSGTSLVVAKELKRQYIGCDINPKAIEITNKRLSEVREVLF